MRKLIVAMATVPMIAFGGEVAAQWKSAPFNDPEFRQDIELFFEQKLGNAILMTDQDCDLLGESWRPYQPISGRFAIASGLGKDGRGEAMDFPVGDEGGEYRHPLTVAEMPEHVHPYSDNHPGSVRADYGDDEPGERKETIRETEPAGASEPHNNIPPYLALNFCHLPNRN